MKPVIGIVTDAEPDHRAPEERELLYVGRPYVDRLLEAGAVPILIPLGVEAADVLRLIDGLMVMGGPDMDAGLFGQPNHAANTFGAPDRFPLERSLFDLAPSGMPFLGICYGCQFLNVVRGGDLRQHLPDELGHDDHRSLQNRPNRIEPGTLTHEVLGADVVHGHTSHHQAIGKLGESLRATAWSEDGVIEAVEDTTGKWIVGLQWHPERTPDDPATQRLFRAFVEGARRFQESRESCGTW